MKRMCLIIILLFLPLINAETFINEIMYNPEGNDNNNEYIEVYTDASLENYTIEDLKSDDILELVKRSENNFVLIVEEDFNFSGIDATIYTVGKTIGNNLNNDRDVIVLRDREGGLVDALSYSSENGGGGNGLSLCKIPDKTGKLTECFPTPGESNSQDIEYKIRINEFLPDPLGDDNAAMPEGEWVELFNYGKTDIDLDGFLLKDEFGRKIFISESQVTGSTEIKKDDILVVYMNGKSGFLNNENFERVSLIDDVGSLIDSVSYSGSSEDVSWALIDDNWILSNPSKNRENPKKEEDVEIDSEIIIKNIFLGSDNKAKWGDNIRVNLEVYKGDTGKESVQMWITKNGGVVSKRTRFNVHEKFKRQELTVPVQIYPNCKEEFSDGNYDLIVRGLDSEDSSRFEIRGLTSSLCKQNKYAKKDDYSYEIIEVPSKVIAGEEFVIRLKITNNLDVKKEFLVWSQVKDGKEILLEDKEKKIVQLPGGSSTTLDLKNSLNEEGDFLLNVKILEEDRKRATILTNSLEVEGNPDNLIESNINEDSEISGKVIYLSKGGKQKKLAIYFFIFLIGMIGVYGLVKND